MTKEKARDILEKWIEHKTSLNISMSGIHSYVPRIMLPIVDERLSSEFKGNTLEEWSFRGLIKIAYDLEDKTT